MRDRLEGQRLGQGQQCRRLDHADHPLGRGQPAPGGNPLACLGNLAEIGAHLRQSGRPVGQARRLARSDCQRRGHCRRLDRAGADHRIAQPRLQRGRGAQTALAQNEIERRARARALRQPHQRACRRHLRQREFTRYEQRFFLRQPQPRRLRQRQPAARNHPRQQRHHRPPGRGQPVADRGKAGRQTRRLVARRRKRFEITQRVRVEGPAAGGGIGAQDHRAQPRFGQRQLQRIGQTAAQIGIKARALPATRQRAHRNQRHAIAPLQFHPSHRPLLRSGRAAVCAFGRKSTGSDRAEATPNA